MRLRCSRADLVRLVFELIVLAIALFATGYFVAHAARAWAFRWPIDYGEGPLFDQARRLAAGVNIYTRDLGPYDGLVANYPPVYPCLLALAGDAFGFSFRTARLIAAAGAGGCVAAIFDVVRFATGRALAAWVAVGVFLACPFVVFWSMLARVDFVALAFALAAVWVAVRLPRARWTPLGAAGLCLLAVATRQSHLLAAPLAVFVGLWVVSPRRALVFASTLAAGLGGAILALDALTGGGFWFHTVTANEQAYRLEGVTHFGGRLLVISLPLVVACLLVWLWERRRGSPAAGDRHLPRLVIGLFLLGAAASGLTIGKVGSHVNHLLPLVAALAMVGGLVFGWASNAAESGRAHLAVAALAALQIPWSWTLAVRNPDAVEDRLRLGSEYGRLERVVASESDPILADEGMGVVALGGHDLVADPFVLTQLARRGTVREDRLIADLHAGRFCLVLVNDGPQTPESWTRDRWTPQMLLALHDAYVPQGNLAGATLYRSARSGPSCRRRP